MITPPLPPLFEYLRGQLDDYRNSDRSNADLVKTVGKLDAIAGPLVCQFFPSECPNLF